MNQQMTRRENAAPAQARPQEQAIAQQQRVFASPAVDVLENEDEFLVVADVPGLSRDDIKIEYHEGELRLEGARAEQTESGWPPVYRRIFRIGDGVDVDKIAAELTNGVLFVHLPKAESTKPRQIPIKSGS